MRSTKAWLLGLSLLGATAAQAAGEDFFLRIPGINGESQSAAYKGWIPIASFTESFVNSASARGGGAGGGGAGRTSCQDMHLSKILDSSSAELAMAVALGHNHAKVELVAVKTGGETSFEFLHFTLFNTVISSVAFAGDSSTSARTETLVLRPMRVEVQYTPQNVDGTRGMTISATVDCASTFL